MKTNTIELGMKIKNCRGFRKVQELRFEAIKAERDVFAAEIKDILTRIVVLTEERDMPEDKLEDVEMKVDGLKEEISSLQEYIEDRVWRQNWGGRI